MESSDDQCSSFESRVKLTKEDEDCIRFLGNIMYFDIIVKETDNKMADQVEKLAATYDRIINRFNAGDSIKYFFFHFADNFGDFIIYDTEKGLFTDRIFDINDIEDENFTFETCNVAFRVTSKFNSNNSEQFEVNFVYSTHPDSSFKRFIVVLFNFGEDSWDQKNAALCIVKDPSKINQNERIDFLKELFSEFYANFFRHYFGRVVHGLPLRTPGWSFSSALSTES